MAKFDAAGNHAWTYYVNGGGHTWGAGIAVDSAGNPWVTGWTDGSSFPVVGGMDDSLMGFRDVFLLNLDSADGSILYSTYFGGEDNDHLAGMTSDGSGAVYLVGPTRSVGFPTTAGAYEENFVGAINGCETYFGGHFNCEDIFVTKLDTDGAAPQAKFLEGNYPNPFNPRTVITFDLPEAMAVDLAIYDLGRPGHRWAGPARGNVPVSPEGRSPGRNTKDGPAQVGG